MHKEPEREDAELDHDAWYLVCNCGTDHRLQARHKEPGREHATLYHDARYLVCTCGTDHRLQARHKEPGREDPTALYHDAWYSVCTYGTDHGETTGQAKGTRKRRPGALCMNRDN